jgi:hypothetical protein
MPNQDELGTIRQEPGTLYVPRYAVRVVDGSTARPVWQYVSFNTAITRPADDADLSDWHIVYTYKPVHGGTK